MRQYDNRGYGDPTYPVNVWLYNGKVVLEHINHLILDFKNMPPLTGNPTSIRDQRLSKPHESSAFLTLQPSDPRLREYAIYLQPEIIHQYGNRGYGNPTHVSSACLAL